MAQADSVPSSSRQLITGESANQSTNLRALNLPAVPASRRHPVCGSHADGAPLLPLSREKRGDEPEDLFKCRYYGTNAGQAPFGSSIESLFFANAVLFLGRLLKRILHILLLFASRNERLRNNARDKASSNQLVPSKRQGRLR